MRIVDFSDGFTSATDPTLESGSLVQGPGSSTDNAVVRFNGTDGKTVQNSGVLIDDSNNVTAPANLNVAGNTTLKSTLTGVLKATSGAVSAAPLVNADVDASAAIAQSKLNLSITNSEVNASAAIAYSKLALSNSIVNADINSSAAIARSKLAALTANRAMITDGSGVDSVSATTATELGYVSGVTSAIQTQLDAKVPKSTYSAKGSILAASAASTPADLPAGTFGQVLTVDSSQSSGLKWASPATGAKNYLSFNNFENNSTTGWSLGVTGSLTNGLPTTTPTFGSGASGNLSISVVSSDQLAGSYSLSYASSAATTAGNCLASDAFTIDQEDQAKVMTVKFYFKAKTNPSNANWSGTSSNSFAWAIYDVTNSAWIIPAGAFGMTQSSGVGICTGTFQTSSNGTQYRLVVYNANATSGAVTVYFDDVFLGPQTAPLGTVVTDWQSYTMTVGATTTAPTYATTKSVSSYWRRVGDSMQIRYTYFAASTVGSAAGSGLYLYSLPSGYSIDTNKVVTGTQAVGVGQNPVGFGQVAQTTTSGGGGAAVNVFAYDSTRLFLITNGQIAGQVNQVSNTNWNYNTANASFEFFAEVPIAGWSSNVQMSSDTDTRVVSFTGTQSSQAVTAYVTNIAFTATKDSHGAWNGTQYVVPVSGDYVVGGSLVVNAGGVTCLPFVNSVACAGLFSTTSATGTVSSGMILLSGLKAGDLISLRSNVSQTVSSGSISIFRLSGPSVIAATETVSVVATSTATTAIPASPTTAAYTFTTKDVDTHGALNAATGVFTAPVSGKYRFSVQYGTIAATINSYFILARKNGTMFAQNSVVRTAAVTSWMMPQMSRTVSLFAGDQLTFEVTADASGQSLNGNATLQFLSIERIGN